MTGIGALGTFQRLLLRTRHGFMMPAHTEFCLEVRLIKIVDIDGRAISADENSIVLIVGPYPRDVGPHTYVYGAIPGIIVTREEPNLLVERIASNPPLVILTRPNNTPAWIKATAVTSVIPPTPKDGPSQAVLMIGLLRQAVLEEFSKVRDLINAAGGQV